MSPKNETRKNRTPEQVVADLEAKIAAVKARAASRQAKANPVGKALLVAVKAIDKALGVAAEAKNDGLARALESSRAPLSEQVVEMGIRPPNGKARKCAGG